MIIFDSPFNYEIEEKNIQNVERIWAILVDEDEIPKKTFRSLSDREYNIFYSLYCRRDLTIEKIQELFKERTGKIIKVVNHIFLREEDRIIYPHNIFKRV